MPSGSSPGLRGERASVSAVAALPPLLWPPRGMRRRGGGFAGTLYRLACGVIGSGEEIHGRGRRGVVAGLWRLPGGTLARLSVERPGGLAGANNAPIGRGHLVLDGGLRSS